jgi:hypothetical protein
MNLTQVLTDPYIVFWMGVVICGLALRKRNDDDY